MFLGQEALAEIAYNSEPDKYWALGGLNRISGTISGKGEGATIRGVPALHVAALSVINDHMAKNNLEKEFTTCRLFEVMACIEGKAADSDAQAVR